MFSSRQFLALGVAAFALVGLFSGEASGAVTCTKVASPTGSDSAAGTVSAPFRTAQHLVDSLQSGDVGCLRSGNFTQDVTINKPNVTLSSYNGETATVVGRLYVTKDGDNTTVSNLNLDGRNSANLPSPTVDGDNITFSGNDVTNRNTAICFNIGSVNPQWGRAHNVVIADNRIHNCGILPAQNHDHGIYVEASDNLVIRDNTIDHNADRGIQLYPDADNTTITGNVIDSNGQGIIFSGGNEYNGYEVSDNNTVTQNLITNSKVRYNVESYYPGGGTSGTGNVVTDNCIHGATGTYGSADGGAGIQGPQDGFTASNNLNVTPAYSNPAAGDYSLPAGSACAQFLGGDTDNPVTPAPGGDPQQPAGGSPPVSPADAKTASRKCKRAKKCRRKRRAKHASA
jgi:parallel beta-helix repeat protein